MYWYRLARVGGCGHAELVEVAGLGGDLYRYQLACSAGVAHSTVVEAVSVHGLPAGLLNGFLERMFAAPGADVVTVVFELVAGVGSDRHGT